MITILLCALGHAIRDGFPPLGSTHAARGLGGFLCVLGGFLASWDYQGALLGLALYAGFYADMQHGEGHRARGWMDVLPLIVSGATSIAPLTIISATTWAQFMYAYVTIDLYMLAVGLLKPVIWFTAWRLPVKWSDDPEGFFVPTRIAAVTWGALVGLLIGLISPTPMP